LHFCEVETFVRFPDRKLFPGGNHLNRETLETQIMQSSATQTVHAKAVVGKQFSAMRLIGTSLRAKRLESNFHQEQQPPVLVPKAGQSPSGDPLPGTSFGVQLAKQCPVCSCFKKAKAWLIVPYFEPGLPYA